MDFPLLVLFCVLFHGNNISHYIYICLHFFTLSLSLALNRLFPTAWTGTHAYYPQKFAYFFHFEASFARHLRKNQHSICWIFSPSSECWTYTMFTASFSVFLFVFFYFVWNFKQFIVHLQGKQISDERKTFFLKSPKRTKESKNHDLKISVYIVKLDGILFFVISKRITLNI